MKPSPSHYRWRLRRNCGFLFAWFVLVMITALFFLQRRTTQILTNSRWNHSLPAPSGWEPPSVANSTFFEHPLPCMESIPDTDFRWPCEGISPPNSQVVSIPTFLDQSTTLHAGFTVDHPPGQVLIVRGILTVFSLGMNELGKKLQELGYCVHLTPAIRSVAIAQQMRDTAVQAIDPPPVIIIGHSLGGDLAPRLARIFGEKNISVELLVMVDSTKPSAPPSNVKRCLNLYQTNLTPDWAPVFRGTRIETDHVATQIYNVDIRKLAKPGQSAGIHHFNIDANPWIHELVLSAVQAVTSESPPDLHLEQLLGSTWKRSSIDVSRPNDDAPDRDNPIIRLAVPPTNPNLIDQPQLRK